MYENIKKFRSLSGIIANANQINIGNLLTNILQIPLRRDWITRFQLTWFSSLNFHLKISTKLFQMFQIFWHVLTIYIFEIDLKIITIIFINMHFRCVKLKSWLKSNDNNCARLRSIVNEISTNITQSRQQNLFTVEIVENVIIISALFCWFDRCSMWPVRIVNVQTRGSENAAA